MRKLGHGPNGDPLATKRGPTTFSGVAPQAALPGFLSIGTLVLNGLYMCQSCVIRVAFDIKSIDGNMFSNYTV